MEDFDDKDVYALIKGVCGAVIGNFLIFLGVVVVVIDIKDLIFYKLGMETRPAQQIKLMAERKITQLQQENKALADELGSLKEKTKHCELKSDQNENQLFSDINLDKFEKIRIANLKELYPDVPENILIEAHKLTWNEMIDCLARAAQEKHNEFLDVSISFFEPQLSFINNINILSQIGGEVYLFFAIFIIFCYSLYNSKRQEYGFPLMQLNTIYLCILSLLLTIFLMLHQDITMLILEPNYSFSLFQNHFLQNSFYLMLKVLMLFIVVFIFLLGITYTRRTNNLSYEFSVLLLLSVWSMCLLISATDLISIYLIIELQSFCFYIITATKSNSNFSTEAGLKYFILGSFSSGLLLFGISLLYGFTGLTNLVELRIFFYNLVNFSIMDTNIPMLAISFSIILIMIGILFKFGLVPFHMYIPDVYTGAPTIVTTLFLVIQKFVILVVYLNLYNAIFLFFFNTLNYFVILSVIASIILGSVTALAQSKIKRLVAYSAIVNGGYLLLGLVIGTIDGVCSSLLFLFIYISLMITLFCIYISTRNQYNNKKLAGFKDFIMLKKGNIALAMSFALILFSIAGIPPLAGFYGKLFLFTSVIKEGSYALAIIAILFTVVTAYYYIRLVKIMFFEKTLKFGFFTQVSKKDAYIISIGTIFNLIFFAMPKLFFVFLNTLLLKFYFFF